MLIMTSSIRTAESLSEFLDSMEPDKPAGEQGRKLMLTKFKYYLARQAKRKLAKGKSGSNISIVGKEKSRDRRDEEHDDDISPALRKKDKEREARIANRRRVRGGAPAVQSTRDGAGNGTPES